MNILLIGNGFDLAHGLPTKYTDFLEFCKMIKELYEGVYVDDFFDFNNMNEITYFEHFIPPEIIWLNLNIKLSNTTEILKQKFLDLFSIRYKFEYAFKPLTTEYDEFYRCIRSNIWINYFLNNKIYQKENWIDFETEISTIIQSIDILEKFSYENFSNISDEIQNIIQNFFTYGNFSESIDKILNDKKNLNQFINTLLNDLNKLIRVLEIYLIEYVEKIGIKKQLNDIAELNPNCVLSFNYTNTYEKYYGILDKNIEYDYIHGKANVDSSLTSNNMVLGIDEYLSKKRRNKEVKFIAFKKFYQRIYKQTGCKYKEWLDKIIKDENKKPWIINGQDCSKDFMHNLYIFGHSLDVTDKDVLRDLILHDNVRTIIYFKDKVQHGQQIANLVRVIGQAELIKRTGGSTKTIEFKLQTDRTVPL